LEWNPFTGEDLDEAIALEGMFQANERLAIPINQLRAAVEPTRIYLLS
jgi:hypothetical protein